MFKLRDNDIIGGFKVESGLGETEREIIVTRRGGTGYTFCQGVNISDDPDSSFCTGDGGIDKVLREEVGIGRRRWDVENNIVPFTALTLVTGDGEGVF